MKVLSLFDGISCGKLALDNLNIPIDCYASSEIDRYAISVSEKNHPDIIRFGDVREIDAVGTSWDLLLGGSPCQSFSMAGKRKGFDGQSNLFWEFIRVLHTGHFKYFFLENVKMKQEWSDIISNELNVQPIKLNSKLFSPQSRLRYYWTNIPILEIPSEDSMETLASILEKDVPSKYFLSENTIDRIKRSRTGGKIVTPDKEKAATVLASYAKLPSDAEYIQVDQGVRKYTPLEFERLQGLPDNYSEGLSDTRRYHAVGNGWNIPTIEFLFKNLIPG